jgi:C-7 ketoreductase
VAGVTEASRTVVITGGGTGIGRAAAREFADGGANVVIVGRTAATLDEAAGGRPNIRSVVADVGAPDAPDLIVRTALDAFGRIDVLVNNAVQARAVALGSLDREDTQAQLATNLLGPIFLTQRALEPLSASRGTVVNISTALAVGQRGWPRSAIYGAAKAALDYLTRTWAMELGPRGIRVVSLAPGAVETGIHERMGETDEQHRKFVDWVISRAPAGRIGQPEEIARWIVRLTEPDAAYLTGVVLPVDGGLSIA